MKRLYEKVGHAFEYNQEQEDLLFTEYVAAARQSLLKKKKQDGVQRKEMKVKA